MSSATYTAYGLRHHAHSRLRGISIPLYSLTKYPVTALIGHKDGRRKQEGGWRAAANLGFLTYAWYALAVATDNFWGSLWGTKEWGVRQEETNKMPRSSEQPPFVIASWDVSTGGSHHRRLPATVGTTFVHVASSNGIPHTSRHPQSLPPYNCAMC